MTDLTFTKTVTMTVDPNELWSNVFGTAGDSFWWWRIVDFIEGDWDTVGKVRLGIANPDDETKIKTKTVGIDDVVAAVSKVLDKGYRDACTGKPIAVGPDMDWDACTSDCVLQVLVLGEVVYG